MRSFPLCFIVLFSVFVSSLVSAQDAPVWKGFVFAHAYQQEGDNDPSLTKLRLKLTRLGKWGGHFDVDASDTENRIQQLYISHNTVADSWRLGRIFLGACYSTPPPFLNRATRYPRAAFTIAAYGYGLQWEHRAKSWNLVTDVTGRSGKAYDGPDQFDGPEASFRVTRNIRSNLAISATSQLSRDFKRGAVDFEHRFRKLDSIGGLYYSDEANRKRGLVGFARTEFELLSWLKPHLQFDARADGNNIWAPGLGFGSPTRKFYAAIDYEMGRAGVGLAARIQFRLDFAR